MMPKQRFSAVSASSQSSAENGIWSAVTGGADGHVQGARIECDKREKVNVTRVINLTRGLTEEDIRKIESHAQDGRWKEELREGDRYSVLFIAICRGLVKDAEYLIQQPGISLDTKCGNMKRTALHAAVIMENDYIVSRILQNPHVLPSQLVNLSDGWKCTALHFAAGRCGIDEIEADTEPEVSREPEDLPETSSKNYVNAEMLLKHGADFDAQNGGFRTPLHSLISEKGILGKETVAFATLLLNAGAEVNTKDEYGMIPITTAGLCESTNPVFR